MPWTRTPPQQVTARDIMVTRLVMLSPSADVFDAIETLVKYNISGAPVVEKDRTFLGVFSEKSCMKVLLDAAYDSLPTSEVRAFMITDAETITEETGFLTICQIFLNKPCRRLPVLRDKELVGQISRRDVIRVATKIMKSMPDRKSTLLYLSALRAMDDTPLQS